LNIAYHSFRITHESITGVFAARKGQIHLTLCWGLRSAEIDKFIGDLRMPEEAAGKITSHFDMPLPHILALLSQSNSIDCYEVWGVITI
jgi:hypothetical protein